MAAGADDYEFGVSPGVAPAGHTRLSSPSDGVMSIRGTSGAAKAIIVDADNPILDADFAGAATGPLTRTGAGTYAVRKDNIAATANPTVDDDSGDGYSVGSLWIRTNATPRRIWRCTNPAVGAAVWEEALFESSTLTASQIGVDTLDDSVVAESNVTQHEAALSIACSQVVAPVHTAVDAAHTFADADHGKCFDLDDATDLVFTLPASGVAVGKTCWVLVTGTGNLTFDGAGTPSFDDAAYAAGPTCTGKGRIQIECIAAGVYWIDGGLDLV